MSGPESAPRGRRPPWWPANEPFPAQGAEAPRMRRRFMRRMGCFVFASFLVFALVVAVFVSVFTQIFSAAGATGGGPLPLIVLAIIGLTLISAILRGVRRVVMPLGDLIDAAESVEAGDYSVRVRSRGPRELRALSSAFNAMSEHLGRSETERRRLLADVTHELRTPLTVIQGNLEAIVDGVRPLDEAHLRAILEDTHVLARLIDDLRTISVAEAGALALHRESTDVGTLVRDTVGSFGAMADAAGIVLKVDVTAEHPAAIDPIRVREILTNIVANALRYTPRDGAIDVAVTTGSGGVVVAVRDTGPGIVPEVLPHVFDRFTRSPESPGAGLGLAIAKSLVTAHGGTIEARSTPRHGTEIRFTLPFGEARDPA